MSANEAFIGLGFLVSRLSGDSTLTGLAPGGVWDTMAPIGTQPIYILVAYQAGSDTTTMNGVRLISLPLYQVKAVGPASTAVSVAAAAAQMDVVLGGKDGLKNITATGGFIAACYREQPLIYNDPKLVNGQMWTMIGGLHRLEIEAN
jgi:hypothetical protein